MKKVPGYHNSIVILHWLIVIFVFILMGTGWYMVGIEKGTPAVAKFYNFHKSIGLIVLALIALLITYRLRNQPPGFPDILPEWEIKAAKAGHWLLYIFLVIAPLSGYIESNFAKWGIHFFGYHIPSWGPENKTLYTIFNRIHVYSSNIFAVLITLHFLAAIKHMMKRNKVVYRMLPESIRPEE
jgi:cytochrome b561